VHGAVEKLENTRRVAVQNGERLWGCGPDQPRAGPWGWAHAIHRLWTQESL